MPGRGAVLSSGQLFITEPIASGGYGAVCSGRVVPKHVPPSRLTNPDADLPTVAVKVLNNKNGDLAPQMLAECHAREVYLSELLAGAPHVVRYMASGHLVHRGEKYTCLVMELYCRSLARDVHLSGCSTLGELQQLSKAVLAALGSTHRLGFVHRDVKPGNIMMSSSNDAHLGDFGTACELSKASTSPIMGTPLFLPRWYVHGASTCDVSVDFWGLGVTIVDVLHEGKLHQRFPGSNEDLERFESKLDEYVMGTGDFDGGCQYSWLPAGPASLRDFMGACCRLGGYRPQACGPPRYTTAEQLLQHPWLHVAC